MIVVGGVSELYQGDLDIGRRVVERLSAEHLGSHVLVEDMHYGAVAVAQRLAELRPDLLVLVGAARRGEAPGAVTRRAVSARVEAPLEAQRAVEEAVTGYVDIDLVVRVATALDALPRRTVAIEVEPALVAPSVELSPQGAAALERAVSLVRDEVGRGPLFELAERVRATLADGGLEDAPAVDAVRRLLAELDLLAQEGRWGRTFTERDRLRACIATGATGEGMSSVDWVLWWSLLEELDRLQAVDAAAT